MAHIKSRLSCLAGGILLIGALALTGACATPVPTPTPTPVPSPSPTPTPTPVPTPTPTPTPVPTHKWGISYNPVKVTELTRAHKDGQPFILQGCVAGHAAFSREGGIAVLTAEGLGNSPSPAHVVGLVYRGVSPLYPPAPPDGCYDMAVRYVGTVKVGYGWGGIGAGHSAPRPAFRLLDTESFEPVR